MNENPVPNAVEEYQRELRRGVQLVEKERWADLLKFAHDGGTTMTVQDYVSGLKTRIKDYERAVEATKALVR
jgi:hypothetical protein